MPHDMLWRVRWAAIWRGIWQASARTPDGGWAARDGKMVIVALDVGDARIGVAACDELELLAAPRTMIRRTTTAAALDAVVAEIERAGARLVVVGLPVSFDGQLHGQARAIQSFAGKLRRRLNVPLIFADETLSSVRAEERLREAGVRGPRIRERIDAEAAAVILGDVLEQRRAAAAHAQAPAPDTQQDTRTDID